MTGELSRRLARWKCNGGEDASYLQLDEKTPEALLQLDIAYTVLLRSIGGRGLMDSILVGFYSKYEIAICNEALSNVNGKNVRRQYLAGSLFGANPS